MIVIARNFGQLGNRLLLSAHLIAAAREYGVTLVNPSFAEYAKYFTSTSSDLWCRYPARKLATSGTPSDFVRHLIYKSVYLSGKGLQFAHRLGCPARVIRLKGDQCCDLQSPEFRRLAQSSIPLLVSGWQFRSEQLLNRHADEVRAFYSIASRYENRVEALIARLRDQADVIVGVHIRHGDYAQFENGKYYFSLAQYAAAMRRVREQLGSRRVSFLVCSNSVVNRHDFGSLQVHRGTGHLIEDMYALAKTDLLLGPPSTFTGWASFYGQKPLQVLESADQPFDVSTVIDSPARAA